MSGCALSLGFIFFLTLLAGPPALVAGQTRVDKSGRPLSKDAGRIVWLEEVLRIRDDGETAVFKSPRYFKLGPGGSLFFIDFAEGARVYGYGPNGRMVHKLLKTGQGPGECEHATNFVVLDGLVRVLSWIPPKIMDYDLSGGRYLRESRSDEDSHGVWFLGTAVGKIYAIRDEVFSSAAFMSEGVFTIPNGVYEIAPDFRTWTKLYEFPVRMVIRKRTALRLDPIDAAIGGSTLYILHTAAYGVTAFDLRTGCVKHVASRAYERVRTKPAKPGQADPESRGIELPDAPYGWDVSKIHAAAGKLWVFTSVMKADGDDRLVDIFDAEGRYADSIVLRFPDSGRDHRVVSRWSLLTDDGFFYIPEQEEDGLITIGKYRVPDARLFRLKQALNARRSRGECSFRAAPRRPK
ncbi:MAG: hypothetical protein JW775_04630 [Candidatus Aminicenantes bacterium]|nr:hypothetical protein [Candidatus Aminicenantes bacterium]